MTTPAIPPRIRDALTRIEAHVSHAETAEEDKCLAVLFAVANGIRKVDIRQHLGVARGTIDSWCVKAERVAQWREGDGIVALALRRVPGGTLQLEQQDSGLQLVLRRAGHAAVSTADPLLWGVIEEFAPRATWPEGVAPSGEWPRDAVPPLLAEAARAALA